MIIIRSKYFSEENDTKDAKKDLALLGTGLVGTGAAVVGVNKAAMHYIDRGANEIRVGSNPKYEQFAKKVSPGTAVSQKLRNTVNKLSHKSVKQLNAQSAAAKGKITKQILSAAKSEKLARRNAKIAGIGAGVTLGSLAALKYRDHKRKKNQE